MQKGLISKTVIARAKRTKFWDHQRKKNVFDGNFHKYSAFLAQKGLISETVIGRAKRTQFWDHQRNKTYLTENFHFWSCDLEKSADSAFLSQKSLISVRASAKWNVIFGLPKEKKRI